jgi:hypothetical protein
MNAFNDPMLGTVEQKPPKLVPVLIGALAITAVSAIPIIGVVNICCCAGVMGGAVLGVWFYRKGFPAGMPFTVSQGALIGTLSGLVAGVLMAVISALEIGLFSGDFATRMIPQMEDFLQKSKADPRDVQQLLEAMTQLASQPAVLFLAMLAVTIVLFTAFGALGGVIGGNIFRTRVVPPAQESGTGPIR